MQGNTRTGQLPPSKGIKYLFWCDQGSRAESVGYSPFFYVEARIDFNDVRTGFRSTIGLNKALEIFSIHSDFLWADDMIRDVDPEKIGAAVPGNALFSLLPDFIDADFMPQMETQFIRYLLRSFKARVFRNFGLDVYSVSGESLAGFMARCLELMDEPRRRELDSLHEVFNRKLEQIKQKYLNANASENFELARVESQNRDVYMEYSERIAELFLQPCSGAPLGGKALLEVNRNSELEERLLSLESEAGHSVARLQESYLERAKSVDEYILHPTLKDIHLVRSGILWIPEEAA